MIRIKYPRRSAGGGERIKSERSPLALIREITRLSELRAEDAYDCPFENGTDRLIFERIAKKPGLAQIEICAMLHMKKPTVSVAVRRLERGGYVRRETDELDHRANRLYPTERGVEVAAVLERISRECENTAVNGLTTNERGELLELLGMIYDNLCDTASGESHQKKL